MARTPIHPGETLEEHLAEINMSAAQLARILGVPTNRITQILAGKRSVTADTALRLGRWLGTGSQFGLNLQQLYDLRLAERTVSEEIERIVVPRAGIPPEAA